MIGRFLPKGGFLYILFSGKEVYVKMEIMKKVMAIALVLVMTLSLAFAASAAGVSSPKNPGYDPETEQDSNTKNHHDNTVVCKIVSAKAATVVNVTGDSASSKKASKVTLSYARNADNEKVAITKVGDGKKGVFDSKKGRYVLKATVKSTASKVALSAYAFKGSKVATLTLKGSSKIVIKENAFKGTKYKELTINISGAKRKADSVKVSSGSFTGLSKKAKVVVSKSTMTKKEFAKLQKSWKKAGFKGSIVRA